jgi:CRP-like cAMP-binding protein
MITVEKLLFLRNVPLFSSLASKELGRVAAVTEEVIYPAGSKIVTEGDYGDAMFLIADGHVAIVRGNQQIAMLGPKNYFGEMSILDGEPRAASAIAHDDCLLLRIGQRDFHEILARHFHASLSIIKTLCGRLRSQIQQ